LSLGVIATACGGDDGGPATGDDDTSSSTSNADSTSSSGAAETTESSEGIDPSADESSSSTGEPGVCEMRLELGSVNEAFFDATDPCRLWVINTHGRVAKVGFASGSIWSRRTLHGTGLLVSAAHILGEGALGPGGTDIPVRLEDPTQVTGIIGTILPQTNGSTMLRDTYSASFALFNPEIPAAESGDGLANILPRHDFYMTVVDGQALPIEDGPAPVPDPLFDEPLMLHDPLDISVFGPTTAAVEPGDLVMVMGYPSEGDLAGELAFSIGRVLDDTEAEAAVAELAAVGDVEGDIAYDPVAEMILEAGAAVGMSGGAAFDIDSRHVGVLVRASTTTEIDTQYVRATRSTYVVAQLQAAFNDLEPADQEAVAIYLEAR
jgi:hypothetical protein